MDNKQMMKRVEELGGLTNTVALQVSYEKWVKESRRRKAIQGCSKHFPDSENCACCEMYARCGNCPLEGDDTGCCFGLYDIAANHLYTGNMPEYRKTAKKIADFIKSKEETNG